MAFIDIEQLAKHYPGGVLGEGIQALGGVDLTVEEGEFIGIMGPSGSGKSTLLAVLGSLCHPTSGRVRVDDIDVYALTSEQRADFRRKYLGFVFQSYNLISYLTALENVMLPLAVKRLPRAEKREQAQLVLKRVGLEERAGHLPGQLSGGEQERVAIARALVNHPPLILADEPTGSLDSASSASVMELLSELNRDGQTIVMVTHNSENRPWFQRVIFLRDGRVASDGDNRIF